MIDAAAVLKILNPSGNCQSAESYMSKHTGKTKYSPVCLNKWKAGCTLKGNPKACETCQQKQPGAVDAATLNKHIIGNSRFGIYPALPDGRVQLVVADIDGHLPGQDAVKDIKTIMTAAGDMDIAISVFSSNSGAGYHVYIFFSEPVAYRKARGLMDHILARCPGLSAFDCVKPSRAVYGTGGGLIALPFHKAAFDARRSTVPVDGDLNPVADNFDDCIQYFIDEYSPISTASLDEIIRIYNIDTTEKPEPEPVDAAAFTGMQGQLSPCINFIITKNPKTAKTNFNKLCMTIIKYLMAAGYTLETSLNVVGAFLSSYPHSGTYTTEKARREHFTGLWRYLKGRADSQFSCSYVLGMAFPGSAFECSKCFLKKPADQKKHPMEPLTPDATRVYGKLVVEPPPAEFILLCREIPFMRKGIVGMLVSLGGMGKTYLMICLAICLSSGNRWGCFDPKRACRTLYIGAEDDEDELNRRLWAISGGQFPENLHAVSMVGKIGPLMRLENDNPIKTEWFEWLMETVRNHMPLDVLMLDPLSRIYGLKENSNEHATAFVAALESISVEFGINVLFSHHANKQSADAAKATQGMIRGASGFVDAVRFCMGMIDVSDDDVTEYELEQNQQFFKMLVLKANGAAKPSIPLFFKKDIDTGVPEYFPVSTGKVETMSMAFLAAFAEHGQPVKKRDLTRFEPKELFEKVRGNLQTINITKDLPSIITYLLENGFIIETMVKKIGRASKMLTVNFENYPV